MNNERLPRDFENLEPPLDAAVRAALAEPLPEDAIERVKARARQLAHAPAVPLPTLSDSHEQSRKVRRVVVACLSLAATLLAIVTGLSLLDQSTGRAFAEMVEKVSAARSVRLTTATRLNRRQETTGQLYLQDKRLRHEQFDGLLVHIADLERNEALFLDTHRKLAESVELDANFAREFTDPIDQLRRAKSDDAEYIGEEILDGRRTHVYRLDKVDLLGINADAEMLVWISVESELPAKITIHDTDPKAEVEIRLENIIWNEPLAPEKFALDIPRGYERGSVVIAPSGPEPKDSTPTTVDASALAEGILSSDRVPAQVLWSPDGSTITALLRDPESTPAPKRQPNELRRWDVSSGKLLWSEQVAGASSVAATADGELLATVIGFEVQLRDAASGKLKRTWATDKPLSPLAFSPDGETLAAGIAEWGPYGGSGGKPSGGVQFWDVDSSSLVQSLDDDKPTTFIGYSTDGHLLASSSNGGPVKLWDVSTARLTRVLPARFAADFSPDGETIACPAAALSADKTVGQVDVYNLEDGSLVESYTTHKAKGPSWLLSVKFSPDGSSLAAADWNGTVNTWNVATVERQRTLTLDAGVLAVAFAPDGETLATGSEDKTLRLWKLQAETASEAGRAK